MSHFKACQAIDPGHEPLKGFGLSTGP